eukprot:4299-Rhodomonas_salina.1
MPHQVEGKGVASFGYPPTPVQTPTECAPYKLVLPYPRTNSVLPVQTCTALPPYKLSAEGHTKSTG